MNNEVKEKINQFIRRHGYKIPGELMPTVKIHWDKHQKTAIINESIGFQHSNEYSGLYKSANSKVYYPYIEYDKEIDVLAFTLATINTSRVAPYVREWAPLDKIYYIVNHQKIFYDKEGEPQSSLRVGDTRCVWNVSPKDYFGHFYSYAFYYDKNKQEIAKIFLEEIFNEAGIRCQPTKFYHFAVWFKQKDKPLTKLKKKDVALIGTELPALEIKDEWLDERGLRDWMTLFPVRITTTETHDVIRIYDNNKREYLRIFVNNKEIVGFLKNNKDEWEKKSIMGNKGYNIDYLVPVVEEIDNSKYIKHIKSLILNSEEYGGNERTFLDIGRVNKIIRLPIIEQLYKAGYQQISKSIGEFAKADLNAMFGAIDFKAKGIYKQLGVNKHQLEDFEHLKNIGRTAYTNSYYCPSMIKKLLKMNDISFLDKETYGAIAKYVGKTRWDQITIWEDGERKDVDLLDYIGITENEKKYIICKRFYKIWQEHENIYSIFKDAINENKYLRNHNVETINIDWMKFKEYSDITRIHDYLANMANRHREEECARWNAAIKMEKEKAYKRYLKKLKENKEKYNFEDEDFLIKYPENPETELLNEGLSLHHCVGGYVENQLKGFTNILFLREKSNPEKAFMTIEVNDQRIKQIHGSHNAWMGSSPEYIKAIPFMLKWLKKTSIHCPKSILTNKAMGYSENKQLGYVELPQMEFDISNLVY